MTYRERVKQARKNRKLTLTDVAKMTGIHFQVLSTIELGKRLPTRQQQKLIEVFLGVKYEEDTESEEDTPDQLAA